jgi:outer membrane protein assembly factor BamB
MNIRTRTLISLLAIGLSLSGCKTISKVLEPEEDSAPLKGERISVLKHRSLLVADKAQQKIKVSTPALKRNKSWEHQGIAPANHLSMSNTIEGRQEISVGSGSGDRGRLTSAPIIANGIVYTLDGEGMVSARSEANLETELWNYTVGQGAVKSDFFGVGIGWGKESKPYLGGNISYGDGLVFLTTERAKVIALNAKNGAPLWTRSVKLPVKTPSMYYKGKLYLITSANTLFALDSSTGKTIWNYSGLKESTSLYGAPSPVATTYQGKDLVIVPFSSGELYAIDAKNGKKIWGKLLSGSSSSNSSLLNLSDIDATPVINRDTVYAVGHEGELSAIDIQTGRTKWKQDLASINTPWVGGKFIYILSTNDELACLSADTGNIKWVKKLRGNEKSSDWNPMASDAGDKILWSGPLLAQESVIVIGSHGKMAVANPYNGNFKLVVNIPEDTFLSPVLVNKKLYILNNDGLLTTLW